MIDIHAVFYHTESLIPYISQATVYYYYSIIITGLPILTRGCAVSLKHPMRNGILCLNDLWRSWDSSTINNHYTRRIHWAFGITGIWYPASQNPLRQWRWRVKTVLSRDLIHYLVDSGLINTWLYMSLHPIPFLLLSWRRVVVNSYITWWKSIWKRWDHHILVVVMH